MDLAVLAAALRRSRWRRGRVLASIVAVAGVTALDILVARRTSQPRALGRLSA
jgi:hypothetical protein